MLDGAWQSITIDFVDCMPPVVFHLVGAYAKWSLPPSLLGEAATVALAQFPKAGVLFNELEVS